MKLSDVREEYKQPPLWKKDLSDNPFDVLESWLQKAIDLDQPKPNAMSLATIDENGIPSTRIVLLKGMDDQKLLFFTNYNSRKGQQIIQNNHVAACIYWPKLERQINIIGTIVKAPREVSTNYFAKRPRGSQIGAVIAQQSKVIESRDNLENAFKALEQSSGSDEIPCPDHWGGYHISPTEFRLWQGRPNRVHDSFCYSLTDNGWELDRLAP